MKKAIKNFIGHIPIKLRQSPYYTQTKKLLIAADNWTESEIKSYQLKQLQNICQLAYEGTPGYRQLFDELKLKPKDITSLSLLNELPKTNKSLLSENIQSFSLAGSQHKINSTGGTTGQSFQFYLSRKIFAVEAAFIHHFWEKVGWGLGTRSLVLRGGFIGTKSQPYFFNNYTKELFFSSSHLSTTSIDFLNQLIKKYDTKIVQSYPSAFSLFCDLLVERSIPPESLNLTALFLGSENIYPWQIEKFKTLFPKLKIHSWYGHAEKSCYATVIDPMRLNYEVNPLYGLIEPGARNEAQDSSNEIVATGFINSSTPFIRYQTKDFAEFSESSNIKKTYSHSKVLNKIDGRIQEVIIAQSGRHLSMTSLSILAGQFHFFHQFQFIQNSPGKLEVHFVPKRIISKEEIDTLKSNLIKKFEGDVTFTFHEQTDIKKTVRGKMRYLVQNLDVKYNLNTK